jgi:predicted DNA-binding transcriptional regulator YafY
MDSRSLAAIPLSRAPADAGENEGLRRITRALRILGLLNGSRPCGLRSLAESCGCSTKTIQRDLDELKAMGVPLEYNAQARSYRLFGPLPFALLDVGLAEATALALMQAAAVTAQGMSVDAVLASAFEKVQRLIPPEVAAGLEASRRALVGVGGAKKDYSQAPLLALVAACREHAAARIDYQSRSSGRRWREVEPYCVAYLDGFWMLVARDPARDEVRSFALDRIYGFDWVRPGKTFAIPEGWTLKEYMAGSVGVLRGEKVDIRLRFDALVAPSVAGRNWRFPHSLEPVGADGSVALTGAVAGLEEITAEILRWGRHVTVESPDALRQRVADEARAIAAKYA